jgi:hypothetical protein
VNHRKKIGPLQLLLHAIQPSGKVQGLCERMGNYGALGEKRIEIQEYRDLKRPTENATLETVKRKPAESSQTHPPVHNRKRKRELPSEMVGEILVLGEVGLSYVLQQNAQILLTNRNRYAYC